MLLLLWAVPAKLAEQLPPPHVRLCVAHGADAVQLPLGVPHVPAEQVAVAEPV